MASIWSGIFKTIKASGLALCEASAVFVANLTTNSSEVFRAGQSELVKEGSGEITGSGHLIGHLGAVRTKGDGAVNLVIGVEGTLVNENADCVIEYAVCQHANCNMNLGTITNLYGFYFPNLSALPGVVARYSFMGMDAGATAYNMGDIATSGDFNNITPGNGMLLVSPDGTTYRLTVANGGALVSTAV